MRYMKSSGVACAACLFSFVYLFIAGGCSAQNSDLDVESSETVSGLFDTEEMVESEGTDSILTKLYTYDFSDCVQLGQYTDLDVTVPAIEVTDSEVQAALDGLTQSNPDYVATELTTASTGYYAKIDYKANGSDDYLETEVFLEEDSDDELITNIIGMDVGAENVVTLSTDSDIGIAAGTYDIILMSIDERVPATVTDEWIASVSDYSTIDDWKAHEKDVLYNLKQEEQDSNFESQLYSMIKDNCIVFDVPSDLVTDLVAAYKSEDAVYAEQNDMDVEDFIQTYYGYASEDAYTEDLQSYVEGMVSEAMLYSALSNDTGVTITSDDEAAFKENVMSDYGFSSEDELYNYYDEVTLSRACLNKTVWKYVCSHNNRMEE